VSAMAPAAWRAYGASPLRRHPVALPSLFHHPPARLRSVPGLSPSWPLAPSWCAPHPSTAPPLHNTLPRPRTHVLSPPPAHLFSAVQRCCLCAHAWLIALAAVAAPATAQWSTSTTIQPLKGSQYDLGVRVTGRGESSGLIELRAGFLPRLAGGDGLERWLAKALACPFPPTHLILRANWTQLPRARPGSAPARTMPHRRPLPARQLPLTTPPPCLLQGRRSCPFPTGSARRRGQRRQLRFRAISPGTFVSSACPAARSMGAASGPSLGGRLPVAAVMGWKRPGGAGPPTPGDPVLDAGRATWPPVPTACGAFWQNSKQKLDLDRHLYMSPAPNGPKNPRPPT